MNKLLGTTPTWGDVFHRFTSPVFVVGLIVLILNFMRVELGWVLPIESLEKILFYFINITDAVILAINDSGNRTGL